MRAGSVYIWWKIRLFMKRVVEITFLTASFFFSFLSLLSSDFNSNISPFFVVVKYLESVIFAVWWEEKQNNIMIVRENKQYTHKQNKYEALYTKQ